jgi:hypothetical protein
VTGLDHRAVVIRCTATNITPADEMLVKYNQLKSRDRQALSGATNSPTTNTITPIVAKTMHSVRSDFGNGREVPARMSSRLGMWNSWLIAVSPVSQMAPVASAQSS